MSTNISIYCVPLAWLLALSPRGYSILTFNTYSKNLAKVDNAHLRTPRSFKDIAASDVSIPQFYRERIIRAECASLNGLENLGFFAAAVALGNTAVTLGRGGVWLDVKVLNRLTVAYLVSRVVYNIIFVRNDTNRFIFVRTGVFMVACSLIEPESVRRQIFPRRSLYALVQVEQPTHLRRQVMRRSMGSSILPIVLLHFLSATAQTPASNLTAISAANNASRLECWQLATEPNFSRAAVNFDLGEFGASFVGITPPRTLSATLSATLSNAQVVQYSLLMAGEVHITSSSSGLSDELISVRITGGRYGWLIAADTATIAAQGHITGFPSDEKTGIARSPVRCRKPPEHTVLHEGPYLTEDLVGL